MTTMETFPYPLIYIVGATLAVALRPCDNSGNMPLPPHRVIKDNQDNAKQDCQGVIAHVASLQPSQQSTRPSHYPCHSPAAPIEQITLQQVRCGAPYPLKWPDKQQDD